MKLHARLLLAATLLVGAVAVPDASPAVADQPGPGDMVTPAWLEDHWIDMASGWEDAVACSVEPTGNTCYRTMAAFNAAVAPTPVKGLVALAASYCGSQVRLFDGTSYTGTAISLNIRGANINLSAYSFDNVTSSYKIGACDSEFFMGANGSGSLYPGNTDAGAQASSMVTGWSNQVSSVYIF